MFSMFYCEWIIGWSDLQMFWFCFYVDFTQHANLVWHWCWIFLINLSFSTVGQYEICSIPSLELFRVPVFIFSVPELVIISLLIHISVHFSRLARLFCTVGLWSFSLHFIGRLISTVQMRWGLFSYYSHESLSISYLHRVGARRSCRFHIL